MKRRARVNKAAMKNWAMFTAISIVGAAIYTNDILGVRSKLIDPLFAKVKTATGV